MKFKSLAIFLIISSFFLTCILSIWKIMATLQGLSFTNLNITQVFSIAILLSLAFVLIGNKINHLIKILSLSFIFSILYFYLNETSPYWYIFGVFLITLFFTNKLKKYSMQSLKEDFISEKIIFDFITLFGIIFFAFVILFPIKTNAKDNKIPIKKTDVTFKLVKLKPCSVAMIFQIDKIHVRKKDEIIKNIARDLNFISPLSN